VAQQRNTECWTSLLLSYIHISQKWLNFSALDLPSKS
jgi:hypothetical protein